MLLLLLLRVLRVLSVPRLLDGACQLAKLWEYFVAASAGTGPGVSRAQGSFERVHSGSCLASGV